MASAKPTTKQLNLLKRLANQTGTSFTYPSTRAIASSEIDRLVKLKKSTPTRIERDLARIERSELVRAAQLSGGASRVREEEIEGYGSSARWA